MNDDRPSTDSPRSDRRDEPSGLAAGLLHAPVADDDRPGRRWAYSPTVRRLISLFVAFHAVALLAYNMPRGELTGGFRDRIFSLLQLRRYIHVTALTQNWGMFAPTPPRHNDFMKVLVEDREGAVWDMGHDIYGRRTYPYLAYSVMGQVNQRLFDQEPNREAYAAWVCRDWERDHRGEPAKQVRLVKMWTRIPPPGEPRESLGYDPMELPLSEAVILTVPCETTVQAQLPPYLRDRYGLPRAPEGSFRPLEVSTWADVARTRPETER
jgi:hypothetical protein